MPSIRDSTLTLPERQWAGWRVLATCPEQRRKQWRCRGLQLMDHLCLSLISTCCFQHASRHLLYPIRWNTLREQKTLTVKRSIRDERKYWNFITNAWSNDINWPYQLLLREPILNIYHYLQWTVNPLNCAKRNKNQQDRKPNPNIKKKTTSS